MFCWCENLFFISRTRKSRIRNYFSALEQQIEGTRTTMTRKRMNIFCKINNELLLSSAQFTLAQKIGCQNIIKLEDNLYKTCEYSNRPLVKISEKNTVFY